MTITSWSRRVIAYYFLHCVLDVIAFRVQADFLNGLDRLTATNRSSGSVDGTRVIGDGHLHGGDSGATGATDRYSKLRSNSDDAFECHKAPNAILACLLYAMS